MAGGYGPDMGAAASQGLQVAGQLIQLQQQNQEIKRQNALRGILGAPDALDAMGQPKPETLNKVYGVDPNAGMKLQQNMLITQQNKLKMDALSTKQAYDRADFLNNQYEPIYQKYTEDLTKGVPEPEARKAAQGTLAKVNEDLTTGGSMSPDEAKHLPRQFDPVMFQQKSMQTKQFMDANRQAREDARLKEQAKRDDASNQRAGTSMGSLADGTAVIFQPNAPPGKRVTYAQSGEAVPEELLRGVRKTGTGGTSAASADEARAERMAKFNVEKQLGRPVDPDSAEDKAAVDQETQSLIAKNKTRGAASATNQDRDAIANVARTDYEKDLGRSVNLNDPTEKAELDRRVLKAEDDRAAGRVGAAAGARSAATGGNDRQAQEKIVRANMETELGRPLTKADDGAVSQRVLAAEDARKVTQAGAVTGAQTTARGGNDRQDTERMVRSNLAIELGRDLTAADEPMVASRVLAAETGRKGAVTGEQTRARLGAQQAAAKPIPVTVNGVRQDAIWKDGKYYDVDGKTPIDGKVLGVTKAEGHKTPGMEAEDDAMAIADKRIANLEAQRGTPLDQAERAEQRQLARIDPKIQEAAKKLDATAISDDAAKLIAEESLRGDWHGTVGMGRNQASMRKVADWRAKLAAEQGLSGADLAANTAEYMGVLAAERVLGTRGAGIDLGISEAQKFAPMVLRASDMVKRTDYPSVNSMIEAVQKGTGGENVIRLIDAMNAYKMAYTQILTRGGMPTDDARRRSDEIINAAWSNGQIRTALDQLNQEMNGARSAVPEVRDNLFKTLTGKTRVSPVDQVPSPVAQQVMGTAGDWKGHAIPPKAIQDLKAAPGTAAIFDQHFQSPGLAASILGTKAAPAEAAGHPLSAPIPQPAPQAAPPAAAPQAAPKPEAKAAPKPAELPDGTIVKQGNKRYRKQGDNWIEM